MHALSTVYATGAAPTDIAPQVEVVNAKTAAQVALPALSRSESDIDASVGHVAGETVGSVPGTVLASTCIMAQLKRELGEQVGLLRTQLLQDLEEKLAQKEESIVCRGQVEIRKLKCEQQDTTACVKQLQERQAALSTHNIKIQAAMSDVMTKFKTVLSEVDKLLRTPLPKSPSTASTSGGLVSESLCTADSKAGTLLDTPSSDREYAGRLKAAEFSLLQSTPLPSRHQHSGVALRLNSAKRVLDEAATPSTLQTASSAGSAGRLYRTPKKASFEGSKPPLPPASWCGEDAGSPTSHAVLSLASALLPTLAVSSVVTPTAASSLSANSSPTRASPGAQRLNLAQCLVEPKIGSLGATATSTAVMTPTAHEQDSRETEAPNNDSIAPAALSVPAGPLAAAAAAISAYPVSRTPSPAATEVVTEDASPAESTTGSATPVVASRAVNTFTIELSKEPGVEFLGLSVQQDNSQGRASLRVEDIEDDGLVCLHNGRQTFEVKKVCVGDEIIAVNGVRGDSAKMLLECKASQRINFTIVRAEKPGNAEPDSSTGTNEDESAAAQPDSKLRPDASVFVPSGAKLCAPAADPPAPPAILATAAQGTCATAPAFVSLQPPPGLGRYSGNSKLDLGSPVTEAAFASLPSASLLPPRLTSVATGTPVLLPDVPSVDGNLHRLLFQ